MFHKQEEHEPGRQRNEILNHCPHRNIQYAFQCFSMEFGQYVQRIFLAVNSFPCIDDEENHRYHFSQRRADSSTGNSQLRETEFTENQDIIEYHIRKYHHNRVQSQRLGLRRTYEEGTEHHHDKREEEPVHTPMNITLGCIVNVRRRNDILEDIW